MYVRIYVFWGVQPETTKGWTPEQRAGQEGGGQKAQAQGPELWGIISAATFR